MTSDLIIEELVLSNLIHDDSYLRTVLPYIKDEYFEEKHHKATLFLIQQYFEKYQAAPPAAALKIELDGKPLDTDTYSNCITLLERLETPVEVDIDWLISQSELFCADKAVFNAVMESIAILNGKSDKEKGSIPEILQEALSVCFDSHIGHDFLEDAEERYDFYHEKLERLPFDIEMLNQITRGGIPKKTLSIILAGTGVGKTLMMCHFAATMLLQGKNVLYITMEMAEERIAERIDANILNVPLSDIEILPKDSYIKKVERVKGKTSGKLIIKEYPTASVGANHFRHLLNELKTKKKFIPDVIFVDYLNICCSSRLKMGANVNTYSYVKSIAEELRGLAVEFDVPIFSATQTNRDGFTSSDPGLENTSESFGLPATADFMFAAINSEELEQLGQLLIKQLKNRFNDVSKDRRFVIGVDRSKMRLFDVEQPCEDVMQEAVMPEEHQTRFDSSTFQGWK